MKYNCVVHDLGACEIEADTRDEAAIKCARQHQQYGPFTMEVDGVRFIAETRRKRTLLTLVEDATDRVLVRDRAPR